MLWKIKIRYLVNIIIANYYYLNLIVFLDYNFNFFNINFIIYNYVL
jgi:hypothetical protein